MSDTFTCPRCGRTSHHPDDARYRYCGACHAFADDAETQDAWLARADFLAAKALASHVAVRRHDHRNTAAEAFQRAAELRRKIEEVQRHMREIAREEAAKLGPAHRTFTPVDTSHEQVITSARLSIRGAHAVLALWNRGGLAGELTLESVCDAEEIARRLRLRDASAADDVYPCATCGRETPHVHEHDTAHGLAETHMAGSERFRCSECGKTTYAHEPGAERMRFVLDKPRSAP